MSSIWAVAKNTIKRAIRMKTAVFFLLLLLILLAVMSITATGDGTLKGRLQTFVSYGLSLTSFLLCVLTIIISVYSITNDIKQKQIYTVLTKPIRRYQLLLGNLVGVILLDVALLTFFSAFMYAVIIYTPSLVNVDNAGRIEAQNEFFTARAGLKPGEPDVSREVNETYEKLEETGQLDELFSRMSPDRIKEEIANRKKLWARAAQPGYELRWDFQNLRIFDPNQSLYLRYKYDVSVNPVDLQVKGAWLIGDLRQLEYGIMPKTPVREFVRKDLIRTFHEIKFPADVIADDGYLAVAFLNMPDNPTTVIFPPDGLEVLYKADTFTANYIRAAFLILLRLIFLACLGILASSFLSFPVAILLCLAVFTAAVLSGFVLESFNFVTDNFSKISSLLLRPIVHLLPQFDKFNPTKFLIPARLLSWAFLVKAAGLMVCLKAVLLFVFAVLIFSFREIAKVII
ncbi:ABC transporter permease [Planctomycetota bacterium]